MKREKYIVINEYLHWRCGMRFCCNMQEHALKAILAIYLFFSSSSVHAHVKWFSPYSLTDEPTALHQFLTEPSFWLFLVCFAASMIVATSFENTPAAAKVTYRLNVMTAGMHERADDMMRVGMGAFLVALWAMGGVILTPELKTDSAWVSWLQLGMALALFWRITMPLTAIGIVLLWGLGASRYGLFHLLDYPIFLGIALYFLMSIKPGSTVYAHRWDVLRWGAAITLMWASIEKFAYPEWSFPVLDAMPFLTLGLDHETFMILAGIAEFALAFALIWTPLIRRLSAGLLCLLFSAAIVPFGKIDAIGHLMIILILIGIVVDDRPGMASVRWVSALIPAKFASLAGFIAAFYGLQATFHGAPAPGDVEAGQTAVEAQPLRSASAASSQAETDQLGGSADEPVLTVWSQRGDDGIWRLYLDTENFIFCEICTSIDKEKTFFGHAHIYRQGEKLQTTHSPIVELDMLDPGEHHLDVVLQSIDHRPLLGPDGPIAAAIVLDVPRNRSR